LPKASADTQLPDNGGVSVIAYSRHDAAFGMQLAAPFTLCAVAGLSPAPALCGPALMITSAGRSLFWYSTRLCTIPDL